MNFFTRIIRMTNLERWEIRDTENYKNRSHVFLWEDDLNICTLIITTIPEDEFHKNDSLFSEIDSLTSSLVEEKDQKFYFELITIDESKLIDNGEDSIETQLIEFYSHEISNAVNEVALSYQIDLTKINKTARDFKCC